MLGWIPLGKFLELLEHDLVGHLCLLEKQQNQNTKEYNELTHFYSASA